MSKLLITGDVHIFDYPNHNLHETDFRLKQFIKLAHRLIEIADEQGCDTLVLAGDTIHKPINPAKTVSIVKDFFSILSKRFDKEHIWLIYGQHDMHTKSQTQRQEDSMLYALGDYYTYIDHKVFEVEGRKIAGCNWRPEQDFSFIEDKVDLLIGHITISDLFGQEYDHSKYELGIAGDIHNPTSNGINTFSTNVPIQHYMTDSPDGSVVVVDLSDMSWERVPTESEDCKFLKLMYKGDERYDESHPYTVLIEKPEVLVTESYDLMSDLNLNSTIQEAVKQSELGHVHEQVTVDATGIEPIDLNFQLVSIEISNFRSIKELKLDFSSGLTAITGLNGSGKSSLMRAIDFALRPPRVTRNLIKQGESEMKVNLVLTYQGNKHQIIRGSVNGGGYLEYLVNEEPINSNNLNELNGILNEKLGFIKLFDVLYRYQGAPYLLTNYGYSGRIQLVSDILGLGLIERIHKFANTKANEFKSELNQISKSIEIESAILDGLSGVSFERVNEIPTWEAKVEECNNELNDISESLKVLAKLDSQEKLVARLTKDLESTKANFDTEVLKKDKSELEGNIKAGSDLLKEFESGIKRARDEVDSHRRNLDQVRKDIKTTERQLANVKTDCPTCKRPLEPESYEAVQNDYKAKIEDLNSIEASILSELDKSEAKLTKVEADNEAKIKEIKAVLDDLRNVLFNYDLALKTKQKILELENEIQMIEADISVAHQEGLVPSLSAEQLEVKQAEWKSQLDEALVNRSECYAVRNQQKSFESAQGKIDDLNKRKLEIEPELEAWIKYAGLFTSSGPIIKSVFTKIANLMTEGDFEVRTVKVLASGEQRIDFDVDYRVNSYWLPYDELSGGQKVLVDMFFLSKLFKMSGRVGALILDETLRDLDPNKLDLVAGYLRESPITSVMLSTHVESFNYYDKNIHVKITDNESHYSVEGLGVS